MSSRDRMNRPDNRSPRLRSNQPSERARDDAHEQDFWDIDQDDDDRYVEEDSLPPSQRRTPRRTRTTTPPQGGTAQQIERLRNNLAGSGRNPSSRQSLGRGNLARSAKEPVPDDGDDAWEDEDQPWEQSVAPQRTHRVARSAPVRQHPYVTETWTDSDGDDNTRYYDDDDDFDEYDSPPRRTPLTQAPSIRLSRPNVSRPSMPSVISQADLVNDAPALGMIGLSLVSLAGMAILVTNRSDTLAPSFATHVSASGVLESVRGSDALWRLPLLAAMITLMNIGAAWFISPIDRFASRFLIVAACIVQIVAWVAMVRIL